MSTGLRPGAFPTGPTPLQIRLSLHIWDPEGPCHYPVDLDHHGYVVRWEEVGDGLSERIGPPESSNPEGRRVRLDPETTEGKYSCRQ